MIEESLNTVLSEDPAIAAIVSGRVFHSEAPQGTDLPYLTFYCYTDDPIITLDGVNEKINSHFQIEIFSNAATQARDLIIAVRAAMSSATAFKSVQGSRRGPYRVDPGYQHCRLEFSIWHD